jgi:ribonuclease P protein subunit RPR2
MGKDQHFRYRNNRRTKATQRTEVLQEVALDRMEYLFHRALEIYKNDLDLANRYIEQIRRYGMAAKIRIPQHIKRCICHHCKKLLVPPTTMRFRLRHWGKAGSFVIVTCISCKHITRYQFKGMSYENRIKTDLTEKQIQIHTKEIKKPTVKNETIEYSENEDEE